MLAEQTGARLVVAPIDDRGALLVEEMEAKIGERTRIVSLTHVSNALGTVNPVRRIADRARSTGAVTVVDGAQAAAHLAVDVRELGCDFYAVSGHKMFAPTGIGALYGRRERLEAMGPWQGGGDMIKSVTFERTVYNDVPHRFEAGTPDIGGAVGLAAAVGFIGRLGLDRIRAHELELLDYGTAGLESVRGVRLIGTAPEKSGVLSFVLEGVHAHDVGTVLDNGGVAVRTGHHCAQPVMDRFGVPATARASLSVFNDRDDLDALVEGLERVHALFG
jgi:cysteine desulfurase/selenocysteine lyase